MKAFESVWAWLSHFNTPVWSPQTPWFNKAWLRKSQETSKGEVTKCAAVLYWISFLIQGGILKNEVKMTSS